MAHHVERLSELFAATKKSNGPRFKHVTSLKTTPSNGSTSERERPVAAVEEAPDHDVGGATSDDTDRDTRTVFVGNLPLSCNKKAIKKLFIKYGRIETIRFRSAAVAPGKLPVGVARRLGRQLTGSCINCYIVFVSADSATSCLEMNGTDMNGRHLRVDRVTHTTDHTHSVFVGNVPFSADEEQLRAVFEKCGHVTSVRVVRDRVTGIGKGFAYVLFTDTSGVLFACQQSGKIELDGRKLRVFQSKNKPDSTKTSRPAGTRPTTGRPKTPSIKQRGSFMGTKALTRSELKTKRSVASKKPKHASRHINR